MTPLDMDRRYSDALFDRWDGTADTGTLRASVPDDDAADDEGIIVQEIPALNAYRVFHVPTGASVDVPAGLVHRRGGGSGFFSRRPPWPTCCMIAKHEAHDFLLQLLADGALR